MFTLRSRHPGIALSLAVAVVVVTACGGDDSASTTTHRKPTTTAAGGSSTTHQSVTTATAPSTTQPETAIWPFADTSRRFDDPVSAARSFAVDYVGFTDPVVGEFRQGDSRSGEVEIRSDASGPVTTVLVRQVSSDDSWWVIGCSTPNLQLASPATGATVSSPVTVSGTSTAFEATVNVTIRQDGSVDPIGTGIVMGGSMGEMGPFKGRIDFKSTGSAGGSIALSTLSAKDGRIWEASVVRVAFEG